MVNNNPDSPYLGSTRSMIHIMATTANKYWALDNISPTTSSVFSFAQDSPYLGSASSMLHTAATTAHGYLALGTVSPTTSSVFSFAQDSPYSGSTSSMLHSAATTANGYMTLNTGSRLTSSVLSFEQDSPYSNSILSGVGKTIFDRSWPDQNNAKQVAAIANSIAQKITTETKKDSALSLTQKIAYDIEGTTININVYLTVNVISPVHGDIVQIGFNNNHYGSN